MLLAIDRTYVGNTVLQFYCPYGIHSSQAGLKGFGLVKMIVYNSITYYIRSNQTKTRPYSLLLLQVWTYSRMLLYEIEMYANTNTATINLLS